MRAGTPNSEAIVGAVGTAFSIPTPTHLGKGGGGCGGGGDVCVPEEEGLEVGGGDGALDGAGHSQLSLLKYPFGVLQSPEL